MPTSITMKTVASHAGVSQGTVSLSLADNPRIPLKTRLRVRAFAEKLGYRPHPYASALMRTRRRASSPGDMPVLALINGLETEDAWRNTSSVTVRQMREGAIEQAAYRGFRAQEFWLHHDGMSPQRFSSMLDYRGIRGVLLGPLAAGAPLPDFAWEKFAAVRLGVPLPDSTVTSVCNDHFFSSLQVARECHRRGYRRPGLVLLDTHRRHFQARWDGGLLVARHLLQGWRRAEPLVLKTWEELRPLQSWIEREKPDVIIAPTSEGLVAHIRSLGYRVPQDIGFASLACPDRHHPCSGVWQNGHLIGATAIDAIVGMLKRNECGLPEQARVTMLEGMWNEGQTLRAPESEFD